MIIALNLLGPIISLLSFVIFIIVLVKSFKHGGVLKGILGIITCGLFTFIWGWIKHKQLKMTKIMATWSILMVAGMVATGTVLAMGISSMLMLPQYVQQMTGNADVKLTNLKSWNKTPEINLTAKHEKTKPTLTAAGEKKSVARQNSADVDWSRKAMALWAGNKYKDAHTAVNYWGHAISSKQNTASAYNNRGLAYHELKQYQEAIGDYNQAIKLDREYAEAYNNRGNSYYELSEYQLALRDFNQSLKLKPNYAKAYLNRGLAFYQMDKNVEACSDFQKSCDQGDCDGMKWAVKNGICK
jgi:Flp pilus assembly protein TadD